MIFISDQCFNPWNGEPNTIQESCSLFDHSVTLNLTCRIGIERNTSASVQWWYSSSRDEAGVSGSEVTMNSVELTVLSEVHVIATLSLAGLSEADNGFYWCKYVGSSTGSYQNPSRVIHINSTNCYPDNKCSPSVISAPQLASNSLRCANGNQKQNISIVSLSNTTCSTPGPKTTPEATTGPKTTTEPEITTTEKDVSKIDATTPSIPVKGDKMTRDTDMPLTTDVGGGTGTTDSSGTTGGAIAGLPAGIIWLIVGLGIALLLIVIAVLLVVIMCLQCSRKRIKGEQKKLCSFSQPLLNPTAITVEPLNEEHIGTDRFGTLRVVRYSEVFFYCALCSVCL